MKQISRVLSEIKFKDWTPKLALMENWDFRKLNPQSTSPTCVFTIRAQCKLDGFEQIFAEWNVDQKDLQRKEVAFQSDPESAYVNFVKAHFNDFMADVAGKFARHLAKQAGLILPVQAKGIEIVDSKHQNQMNQFKNLMHDHKQRKKRWG